MRHRNFVLKSSQTATSAHSFPRALTAEFLGTALLLAIVVGSGVMGERLSGGSDGLALLGNTLATGAGLVVLILMFGTISGAHFNPVVSFVEALRGKMLPASAAMYALVQIAGAVLGVFLAHAMFDLHVLQASTKMRDGGGQIISEAVATFGLIGTIMCTGRFRPDLTPVAVGLYITSAYWFTASTSFANPAVTIARSLTDTFAGIAPASVAGFMAGQIAGALLAFPIFGWLIQEEQRS